MKTSTIIVSAILMLLATSCVHYYYAPSGNNVPLFKEKNEVRVQAQYSTVGLRADESNTINGFEIQGAVLKIYRRIHNLLYQCRILTCRFAMQTSQ